MTTKTIKLDKFVPRPYQWPLIDAVFKDKFKNLIAIMPRRAGKDLTAWNICIELAIKQTMLIYYILPTYSQAKKTVWQALANDGSSFLSYIPDELIKTKHEQDMSITLINNSRIQLIGGDSYNTSLVGTNPKVCVFSEYSLMNKEAYDFAAPILAANDGIAIFLYTPRGRNHAYELYQAALRWPDWFVYKLTLDDTKHISQETLENERKKHSEEFIQQEWFCDFSKGIEGSVYGRLVDIMRNDGRICPVSYIPTHKVHTAWDLGIGKNMFIVLFQVINNNIYVFDTISLKNGGLPEHINEVLKRNYVWGIHIGPHDLRRHDIGTNVTIWGMAKQLGILFTQAPGRSEGVSLVDGIETLSSIFPRLSIDQKCDHLIASLENYHYEFDEKHNCYKDVPVKDWTSHAVDAMRYLALCADQTADGLSASDLDKRYLEAKNKGNPMNNVFQQPFGGYR